MMSCPRESQIQTLTRPVTMSSTSSGYISDDGLLTKDLPMASDVRADQSQTRATKTNISQSYFDPSLPYHLQADWMRSNSSTPLSSQNSYGSFSDSTNFDSSINNYSPTFSQAPSPPSQSPKQQPTFQSAAEKLAYQTARRRAQNRESQRAFRERKNNQIAELESKLSDLQGRYEKLQLCFVELSGRLVSNPSNHDYNGTF
jgi:hypothetical protein